MFEIGNSLREARLRQQLEFPEIEQATKIRGKYLRALEEEQFQLLPAETYVKGFLRTYAEYLGLDGQLYVDEYNSRYVTVEEAPIRPRRVGRGSERRIEANAVLVALSAIGIVTALVIAAWKFGSPDERETPLPNLQPTQTRAERPRQAARKPEPRPRRPRAPARAVLVVTAAAADSWLEVHAGSPAGRELYRGTLAQGESQRFTSRRLWINVGRPHSLRWTLNGRVRQVPGANPHVLVVTPTRIIAGPPV